MHLSLADESTIKANNAGLQEEESGFSQSSEYLAAMGFTTLASIAPQCRRVWEALPHSRSVNKFVLQTLQLFHNFFPQIEARL